MNLVAFIYLSLRGFAEPLSFRRRGHLNETKYRRCVRTRGRRLQSHVFAAAQMHCQVLLHRPQLAHSGESKSFSSVFRAMATMRNPTSANPLSEASTPISGRSVDHGSAAARIRGDAWPFVDSDGIFVQDQEVPTCTSPVGRGAEWIVSTQCVSFLRSSMPAVCRRAAASSTHRFPASAGR